MKTAAFALFALTIASARADLALTLTPSVQPGAQGAEIVFSGTITNNSATDTVFLNDIAFGLSGASATNLSSEPANFFANVPGILLPNESYTSGEIFRVVVNGSAPVGDYGGTVSILGGADIFATGSLAGTGFTVHETPMENWRFQSFGENWTTPQAADAADYDGDGISNLMEYALGLNPTVADVSGLPASVISGGYLTLSYVPNSLATDVTFTVEASTDLLIWSTDNVEVVSVANPNPPGSVTYRYSQPTGGTLRAFLRLSVTH